MPFKKVFKTNKKTTLFIILGTQVQLFLCHNTAASFSSSAGFLKSSVRRISTSETRCESVDVTVIAMPSYSK